MDEREKLVATGFALGALVGGAIVAVMGSSQREAVGRGVRNSLEQWVRGKSPRQLAESVRDGVGQVADTIDGGQRSLPRGRE